LDKGARQEQWGQAIRDPEFLRDIREVEAAFAWADAESLLGIDRMDLEFSQHAEVVMQERGIFSSWLHESVDAPDRVERAPDGTVHYLNAIEAFGGRWLRVVVNESTEPARVVTLFFDRRVR
jgi:hypothetical protein